MPTAAGTKMLRKLARATKESRVEDAYSAWLGIDGFPKPFNADGLYDGTLFEFKYKAVLSSAAGSTALAQCIYYLREILHKSAYKGERVPMPIRVAVCDTDEAFVLPVSDLMPLVTGAYDWDRPASSPDPTLITACTAVARRVIHLVDDAAVMELGAALTVAGTPIAQLITTDNFADIFEAWKSLVPKGWTAQQKALAYLQDIQVEAGQDHKGRLTFNTGADPLVLHGKRSQYDLFWALYRRPPDNETLERILQHKDQLVAMQTRRREGEFFTPIEWAAEAHKRIARHCGDDWTDTATLWDPACYSDDTEMLTPSGWKLIKDVTVGEQGYSFNPHTQAGEYVEVLATQSKHAPTAHHYKSRRIDLLVTPDHQMYVEPRLPKDRVDRSKFDPNTHIRPRKVSPFGLISSAELAPWNTRGNVAALRAAAALASDEQTQPPGWSSVAHWLLGFWLGDGYLFHDKRGKVNAAGWGMYKPHKIKVLTEALQQLGWIYTTNIGANGKRWFRTTDADFLRVVRPLGSTHTKYIPAWAKAIHLDAILDGLWASDGSGSTYYSANQTLADDVAQVCVHAGYAVTTRNRYRVAELDGRTIQGMSYEVHRSRCDYKSLPRRSVTIVQYDKTAYCVSLAKNHIMLVRRNGKTVFCGNCGTGNLTLELPPMPGRLFLSTLNTGDIRELEKSGQNAEAVKFQYDFLNDPAEQLPEELRAALEEPVVWLLNPPFAAGVDGTYATEGKRSGMTKTTTCAVMKTLKMGHACQNLYAQFMFRIGLLSASGSVVGLFSMPMFVTGPGYSKFREWWGERFDFLEAFTFHCKEFQGASGNWPVLYSVWRRK
jgi:hypothetical protein